MLLLDIRPTVTSDLSEMHTRDRDALAADWSGLARAGATETDACRLFALRCFERVLKCFLMLLIIDCSLQTKVFYAFRSTPRFLCQLGANSVSSELCEQILLHLLFDVCCSYAIQLNYGVLSD